MARAARIEGTERGRQRGKSEGRENETNGDAGGTARAKDVYTKDRWTAGKAAIPAADSEFAHHFLPGRTS